jgi:hypothetical protein
MKRIPDRLTVALTALALLLLVLPAVAAPVAFQATTAGPIPSGETVALDPPIVVGVWHTNGQSALTGAFTYVEAFTTRLGVDGNPLGFTGQGVITAANGDAIYISDWGVGDATAFIVTGGKGRFKGATGSGRLTAKVDKEKNELTCLFDGMIDAPAIQ